MVIGWAGWDHLDQARALARLIVERTQGEGISPEHVLPLVADRILDALACGQTLTSVHITLDAQSRVLCDCE